MNPLGIILAILCIEGIGVLALLVVTQRLNVTVAQLTATALLAIAVTAPTRPRLGLQDYVTAIKKLPLEQQEAIRRHIDHDGEAATSLPQIPVLSRPTGTLPEMFTQLLAELQRWPTHRITP